MDNDLPTRLREQWEPGGDIYAAADEIERLRNELEVSEAVSRAKTELILDIQALIKERTGPPRSKIPNQDVRDMVAALNNRQPR